MASSITLEKEGQLFLDVEAVAAAAGAAAVGHVKDRNHDGLDTNDQPFKPYSDGYARALEARGESTKVDHRVSGLMLSMLDVLKREVVTENGQVVKVTLLIGVKPGGDRNLIGAYLQKLRSWLGLSPRGQKSVNRAIEAVRAAIKSKNVRSKTKV